MFIFIKALPLSLSTFWRYLIVLPFLGIAALILSLFTFIPFVGLLVPGMVTVWLTVIGLRCALLARGYTQPLGMGTIFTICLYFSVVFLVVNMALKLFMVGYMWAMEQAGATLDPLMLLAGLIGASPYATAQFLGLMAPVILTSAAFAVPLVAAAASTGRHGWDHNVLKGFGRGVFGLCIVCAVGILGGHLFSFFGEVWTFFGLVVGVITSLVEGDSLQFETDLSPWTVLRGALIMAWASSWYFATAVLTWEKFAKVKRNKNAASKTDTTTTTDDIRELRRARMQKLD